MLHHVELWVPDLKGAVGPEDKVFVIFSFHHAIDFSIKRLWWRILNIFPVRIIPIISELFILSGGGVPFDVEPRDFGFISKNIPDHLVDINICNLLFAFQLLLIQSTFL